jgi:hypothetical protein
VSAIPHYLCFVLAREQGAPDAIDWVAEQLSRQIPNPVFIVVVVIAVYLASRWTSKIQRERAIQRERKRRERAE